MASLDDKKGVRSEGTARDHHTSINPLYDIEIKAEAL